MNLTREFIRQFGRIAGIGYNRHGSRGCRFAELVAAEAGGKSNGKENTFFRFADPTTVAGLTGKVDKPASRAGQWRRERVDYVLPIKAGVSVYHAGSGWPCPTIQSNILSR